MAKKIKYILLFSFLIILGLCTKSQARITTSDPTVSSGGTATITINSQEEVTDGAINVVSDGGLTFVSVSGGVSNGSLVAFSNTTAKTSGIATYEFKVPKVSKTTKYKVTFSATDMSKTENGETIDISDSKATSTVTVTAEETSSGGNTSSGGGSSSSSGNNSSGGNSGSSSSGESTPSFTEVNETVYATSSVNIRSSYSTSSSVVGSLDAGDSVTRTGRGSNGWSRVSYNGQTAYISSSYLTTEKPEESNNKNLESLTLGDGLELTPAFSSDVTEYTLTVGDDVTSIDVTGVAEDENAKVEVTGNDNLLMGENTIEIKVTAEDGTERTYTITVTKGEAGETVVNGIGLSELSVEGYTLSPEFSSNVYEYTLDVPDTSVTNLTINAKSNLETAVIEIAGNNELVLGENIITILVKSENEDGEAETVTYQIIANIHEPEKTQIIAGIDDEDLFLYGGIALAVLIILIIIIIVVVVKRRRNREEDYGTYYGGFSSLNREEDNTVNQDSIEETDKNTGLMENNNEIDYSNATTEIQPEQTSNQEPDLNEREQTRRSVIEENFGADIKPDYYEENTPKRKKGKHF